MHLLLTNPSAPLRPQHRVAMNKPPRGEPHKGLRLSYNRGTKTLDCLSFVPEKLSACHTCPLKHCLLSFALPVRGGPPAPATLVEDSLPSIAGSIGRTVGKCTHLRIDPPVSVRCSKVCELPTHWLIHMKRRLPRSSVHVKLEIENVSWQTSFLVHPHH
jgi:hypothetical protein